jgi:hypothetical protein
LINIVVYLKPVADSPKRISRKGAKNRKDAKFVAPLYLTSAALREIKKLE